VKGHNERRYSTSWPSPPGPRLREYILVLRAIWDSWQNGTRPNFQGKHYTYTLMTPFFNPGPIEHPHIPVHISAVNPYMCRLAGELCDGVRLHAFCTPKYLQEVIIPSLEEGAQKAGRSWKDLDISGGGFIVTGEKQEDLERQIPGTRSQIAFYASTRTYKGVLDMHGWGETCLRLNRMVAEGKWAQIGREITDEMLEQFCVIGTYDEIVDKIRERWGGIINRVALNIPTRGEDGRDRHRAFIRELQAI
jgi:probable F420-dependent oxidoreductase